MASRGLNWKANGKGVVHGAVDKITAITRFHRNRPFSLILIKCALRNNSCSTNQAFLKAASSKHYENRCAEEQSGAIRDEGKEVQSLTQAWASTANTANLTPHTSSLSPPLPHHPSSLWSGTCSLWWCPPPPPTAQHFLCGKGFRNHEWEEDHRQHLNPSWPVLWSVQELFLFTSKADSLCDQMPG